MTDPSLLGPAASRKSRTTEQQHSSSKQSSGGDYKLPSFQVTLPYAREQLEPLVQEWRTRWNALNKDSESSSILAVHSIHSLQEAAPSTSQPSSVIHIGVEVPPDFDPTKHASALQRKTVEALNAFLNDLLPKVSSAPSSDPKDAVAVVTPIDGTLLDARLQLTEDIQSSPNGHGRLAAWKLAMDHQLLRLSHGDPPLYQRIQDSLQTIQLALDRYGLEGIACSFNGGKDCTVLLHLLTYACVSRGCGTTASSFPLLKTVYIVHRNGFAQVEAFTDACVSRYQLDLMKIQQSMKQGLQLFCDAHPEVKAILVGTRRTDPFCAHLESFSPTDEGWPTFMRVNPILDWSYADVWMFLRWFQVPYCVLYDRGYSSLGGRDNTVPNPNLRNPHAPFGFDPAYCLQDKDGVQERTSRSKEY